MIKQVSEYTKQVYEKHYNEYSVSSISVSTLLETSYEVRRAPSSDSRTIKWTMKEGEVTIPLQLSHYQSLMNHN
jgi:hypothetical protein